ncbi:MAG: hypothetical protein ABI112_17195 [Terracoccus sp.]
MGFPPLAISPHTAVLSPDTIEPSQAVIAPSGVLWSIVTGGVPLVLLVVLEPPAVVAVDDGTAPVDEVLEVTGDPGVVEPTDGPVGAAAPPQAVRAAQSASAEAPITSLFMGPVLGGREEQRMPPSRGRAAYAN